MGERKRIGLLLAQADENYQSAFIEEFLRQAFAYDYDVCIFSMCYKKQENHARELGESNIYNLINYDLFDGFVILPDTIQTTGVAEQIQKRMYEKFKGPVLCVDKESKYFPYILTDHYTPMKKLISHLIEAHHYQNIIFVSGRKEHIHSKMRESAYLDAMKEHGLNVEEEQIFHGNYWYDCALEITEKILQKQLPDAIACANDYMAIGIAECLSKAGYQVPEDVAVIGYDSVPEGRNAPSPLTSAEIPAKECGHQAALRIHAMIENEAVEEYHSTSDIIIGRSCGCNEKREYVHSLLRSEWGTTESHVGYYSIYNRIMEDMLSQETEEGFFNTVRAYVHQLRNFDSFHICLCQVFNKTGQEIIVEGYTPKISRIIRCGSEPGEEWVDFKDSFEVEQMLPELFEKRETPKAFTFTPMNFDERCYGYAVISYGNQLRSYDETYRLWIRSVTQGMEALRRHIALRRNYEQILSAQIRDGLTGLYNYHGFMQKVLEMQKESVQKDAYLSIIVLDLAGVKTINNTYGREAGDEAIRCLAKMIDMNILRADAAARLGNDEFIIATLSPLKNNDKAEKILLKIRESVEQFNKDKIKPFSLKFCYGMKTDKAEDEKMIEMIVNTAVSIKNRYKKINERNQAAGVDESPEELKTRELVFDIIEKNLFIYHFQPIINAHNGEVYSYEALMRSNTEEAVSPLVILRQAEKLGQLYEVERATFFNVLNYLEEHSEKFVNKKVFINSIPGYSLKPEDQKWIMERLMKYSSQIVVELTEQSEVTENELREKKEFFGKTGTQTAIDDYGTGYSNVYNLLRYMPDYVKIDRSLISDIDRNPQKQHFVKEIIKFAHDNNFMALAEGVETAEELREVIHMGVDLIQGYYTARPMPDPMQQLEAKIKEEIIRYRQEYSHVMQK